MHVGRERSDCSGYCYMQHEQHRHAAVAVAAGRYGLKPTAFCSKRFLAGCRVPCLSPWVQVAAERAKPMPPGGELLCCWQHAAVLQCASSWHCWTQLSSRSEQGITLPFATYAACARALFASCTCEARDGSCPACLCSALPVQACGQSRGQ
jgi:hypothetical protein